MTIALFVGDELVSGHGDAKALGWTGRVAARALAADPALRWHALGVPAETTADLAARWEAESSLRIGAGGAADTVVVFAVGRHDVYQGVSTALTRLHLAESLDRAAALGMRPVLAGPPPGTEADNDAIAELSAVCEEAAARRSVPFVDLYGPLARHEQWLADLAVSDEALPGQAGYGLMAWLVLHSPWADLAGIAGSIDA